MLQHGRHELDKGSARRVSNPISGEVGAAAWETLGNAIKGQMKFQTPSAGRWVLQPAASLWCRRRRPTFQTPSAGRWVLQPDIVAQKVEVTRKFQTPSAGRWVLQQFEFWGWEDHLRVSNPISGEVGAAAGPKRRSRMLRSKKDVSNPISGEVGAAAGAGAARH